MTDKVAEAEQLTELGYSSKAIELYQKQVNVGVINDSDTDAVSLSQSGDLTRLYIKINDNVIKDAKFLCYGCPGSLSAMSALTLIIKGKTLAQANKLTRHDILETLDGLPESKKECAELPIKTLKKALEIYQKNSENKATYLFSN
jgi:nitrogen fixation NifU-like protein